MGSSPPAADDDRYQDELWKQPTHATLLVSDADAGRVIGRRGSAVAGVESTSGAQVRLSRRGQFLPGTESRVLLVSGLFHQVMDAAELILQKIIYQGDQVIDDRATVVLVVPDACCGALIGKGGTAIKSLAIASNAGIVVSPQDVCYGLNDRLVTITGHLDNQLQAIFLILSELLEDDRYSCSYAGELWKHPTHATLLVSDGDAGRVIGRRGSAVAGVESTSGAQVRLSRRGQLLPGSDSRVLLVSGLFHQVMDAAELILKKIIYQGDQVIDDRATVVLVVPDACCGALIGKGGTVIKSLAIAANAGIVVSPQDVCYGLNDRLVTITGHLDNQLQAIFLILSELLEDDRYSCSYASSGVPFPYPISSVGCEDHGPDEHVERYHSRPKTPMRLPDNNDDDAQESITIAIADEHIGAVIGRGGKKIMEIFKATGAWIQTSAKGDFIAGTNDREVVISGTREAVDAAEAMIMQVVSASRRRSDDERPPLELDTKHQQLEAPLELDTTPQQLEQSATSDMHSDRALFALVESY